MNATLQKLKESNEDFEWYPTTDKMIKAVAKHCGDIRSLLDVGSGDGRVLTTIRDLTGNHIKLYAIEKSEVHIERMPPDISIVGTDFILQTLIDKEVDVVFCNPPYSEYEEFATKIIQEAHADFVFLILPKRWRDSAAIKAAIESRGIRHKMIWSGDFLDAERSARARVEILKLTLKKENDWGRDERPDPFDSWFDSYFPEFDKLNETHLDDEGEKPVPKYKQIARGQNLIERLHEFYIEDMNNLLKNYRSLCGLDPELLKELGVKHQEVKEGLKLKIAGKKNEYWQELFSRLDKIKQRLTTASRNDMLEKMRSCGNLDYTADNAYAVVIWVIKNANQYIDSQLVDMFKKLTEPKCIKNYKSNLKTWESDGWRYKKEDHSHYTLDYRIVTHACYCAIEEKSYFDNGCRLHRNCHAFLSDIFTIANNLGFSNYCTSENRQWSSGKSHDFWTTNDEILVNIRAFKNGNVHLKFNQDFIKTLNIETSRLLGWVKTPCEAADEMGIDFDFVQSKFRTNLLFEKSDQKLLTA